MSFRRYSTRQKYQKAHYKPMVWTYRKIRKALRRAERIAFIRIFRKVFNISIRLWIVMLIIAVLIGAGLMVWLMNLRVM